MHKWIVILPACLFAANVALAQTPAGASKDVAPAVHPAAASNCETNAVSKAGKPLYGAAKAAFIKKCESANKPATAGKSAQMNKMAMCNKDATGKKGAERKAFMKECLSK